MERVLEGGLRRAYERRVDPRTGQRYLAVAQRGPTLLNDPILNKGTCFTLEERQSFGLSGLLPPAVATEAEQAARAYENFGRAADDVQRYLFLAGLQDRNETLFYRLLVEHMDEMAPIVYTPTVGKVCEQYSHIYRRPRGICITSQDRGRVRAILRNWGGECRVAVVTDNAAILGLGDQGVGGMGIAIGKLALYTAGAGIAPEETLPIDFDVGTDNPKLLADPLYLGMRHPRLRGAAYDQLLDELVDAMAEVHPAALIQWEDFSNRTAFDVLERYRRGRLSFNDDIQGTGAIVVAGIRSALRQAGRDLADERFVFFGAGASGAGSVLAVRSALRDAGVPERELASRVLALDSKGLILEDRDGLPPEKREIAASLDRVAGWTASADGRFRLADVVLQFRPGVLVGASGQPGAFSEEIVRGMAAGCGRPIILALSNPTNLVEATPEQLVRWTDGAAIVGTGSPFPPVEHRGRRFVIGQGNNVLMFPGLGLGATTVGARWLPDRVFTVAAQALFELTSPDPRPGTPIYPPLSRLREISRCVARAVARELVACGEAPPLTDEQIERRLASAIWTPEYLPYRPVSREDLE
ncbi:MAG TPA: NAD-dependent malic enzyme [Candidatus Eisenbacteria bacterium]|nr:NAD-dependent malic enzyme [Candidatus Eisenbacteria bacterium]